MRKDVKCEALFVEAWVNGVLDASDARPFLLGFVAGQCEKVYLGACRAAMFRPAEAAREFVLECILQTAPVYGLLLERTGDELWVCRDEKVARSVALLSDIPRDSPAWHRARGELCGIPFPEIDPEYHLRPSPGSRAVIPRGACSSVLGSTQNAQQDGGGESSGGGGSDSVGTEGGGKGSEEEGKG